MATKKSTKKKSDLARVDPPSMSRLLHLREEALFLQKKLEALNAQAEVIIMSAARDHGIDAVKQQVCLHCGTFRPLGVEKCINEECPSHANPTR